MYERIFYSLSRSSMPPEAPRSQTKQDRTQVEPRIPQQTPEFKYELPSGDRMQCLDDAYHGAQRLQSRPTPCKQANYSSRQTTSPWPSQRQRHWHGEDTDPSDHKIVDKEGLLSERDASPFRVQADVPAARPD